MGFFSFLFPWGLIFQAIAIVHFIKRRPDTIWLYVIVFLGPLGAAVYIVIEVVPDLGLIRQSFDSFGRKRRIQGLTALVQHNPAAGNWEELGDLYLEEGKWAKAREAYDKAISPRMDSHDAKYRRGVAEIQLGDFEAAARDLAEVHARDPKYDFYRGTALLAHAYAQLGRPEEADALFRQATEFAVLSETFYNYASFLAAQGRHAEAREWAQKILDKKPGMPRYLQRRERPWFRKAKALLKRVRTS